VPENWGSRARKYRRKIGAACPKMSPKIRGRVPEYRARISCPNIVPEIFCPNKVPECLARKLCQKLPCPKVPPIVCPNFVTEFQCKQITRFIRKKMRARVCMFLDGTCGRRSSPIGAPAVGHDFRAQISGTVFGHRFSGTDFGHKFSGTDFRAHISPPITISPQFSLWAPLPPSPLPFPSFPLLSGRHGQKKVHVTKSDAENSITRLSYTSDPCIR